jgi:hypothetical protein
MLAVALTAISLQATVSVATADPPDEFTQIYRFYINWSWSVVELTELTAGPLAPGDLGVHAFSVQSHVDSVEGLKLYVTYISVDKEVHQLRYEGAFGAWRDLNLSAQVIGPPTPLIPDQKSAAYLFRARGTVHVVYLGFASLDSQFPEIQELWADQSGWHGNNLTRATGAPSPARASPSAYAAEFEKTQHVHYVGRDGHLHELWWNSDGWHWHDFTVANGAPLALPGTSPASFVSEPAQTQHAYFVGQDGQIHGIRWRAGNWSRHDPDLVGGTPGAASVSPVGYISDEGVERVAYVGLDGHVHELSFDGNAWDDQDTNASGGGALAAYPGGNTRYAATHCHSGPRRFSTTTMEQWRRLEFHGAPGFERA